MSLAGSGCASIWGWDIHAPGILSPQFSREIKPIDARAALFIPESVYNYRSTDRGGRFADPQTFHIGEAYVPMMVEGFQAAFSEFILIDTEPTPEIMKQYGIEWLAAVGIKSFTNRVTLKGQTVGLKTEAVLYDRDLRAVHHFESQGSSDQRDVFAKKGGPQVNLNAALERNVIAVVQHLQDQIQSRDHEQGAAS